jgi:glycosyltransferase involved in cell wall biosynthesis
MLFGGGAPKVLFEMLTELKELDADLPVMVVCGQEAPGPVEELERLGIPVVITTHPRCRFTFKRGDVALLNSRGHPNIDFDYLTGPGAELLSKIFWYVHESDPEFFNGPLQALIGQLIGTGKLEFAAPAIQTVNNYRAYVQSETAVQLQGFRMAPPFRQVLEPSRFSERLDAILVGGELRGKGHHMVGYAYIELATRYVSREPELYRKPTLRFVGIEALNYRIQLLAECMEREMKGRVWFHPQLPQNRCWELITQSNLTVCASFMECLPISVYEGMFAGHVLVRNGCSGVDEQLDGNGVYFEKTSFEGLVGALEQIHNREKTSDEALSRMSARSLELAKRVEKNTYEPLISRIRAALGTSPSDL